MQAKPTEADGLSRREMQDEKTGVTQADSKHSWKRGEVRAT